MWHHAACVACVHVTRPRVGVRVKVYYRDDPAARNIKTYKVRFPNMSYLKLFFVLTNTLILINIY